jgi:hypothetical protein
VPPPIFPLPPGISYDGEMRSASHHILLFTLHDPASAAYRATIALQADAASRESLVAKILAKEQEFAIRR